MQEVIDLIGRIIADHREITKDIASTQKACTDIDAISELGSTSDHVVPRRLPDQSPGLQKLEASLEVVEKGLTTHFDLEEKSLLKAFEIHGDMTIATALHTLLMEHSDIFSRLAHAKKSLKELMTERLSREVWEGKLWGLKAYINQTGKIIEMHAQSELELMQSLEEKIKKAK
ncbi:MAG TPA: hypothetical protein DCX22_04695 [Dehalococcoidia bacterium]|nr:hypothetical protein [Dehalococcoidia bacterium]